MKINEAKQKMLELVAAYFGESHVFFARAKKARVEEPYAQIQMVGFEKYIQSIDIINPADEHLRSYRKIDLRFQVDLYTKGRNVADEGKYEEYENTALEDMEDFDQYMESEYSQNMQDRLCMLVIRDGDIKDTSALVNDSTYQYRATVFYDVSFWDESHGYYGQNGNGLPNSSSGGDVEMITDPYVLEDAEIKGGIKS